MSIWPSFGPVVPSIISPVFEPPYGDFTTVSTGLSSTAWGTNNLAYFFPIYMPDAWTATKIWWQNGSTVSGNVDVGIYSRDGARIVSTGATAQSGTTATQSVDITDTLIPAGLVYFGISCSSSTATFWSVTVPGSNAVSFTTFQQTTAHPLPNPATFANATPLLIPKFGVLVAPRTVL